MRLILILLVLLVVGWLAAQSIRTQRDVVGRAAREAGASVPQGTTPREQAEAVGKAVEQQLQQGAQRTAREADQAAEGK